MTKIKFKVLHIKSGKTLWAYGENKHGFLHKQVAHCVGVGREREYTLQKPHWRKYDG